MTRSPEAKGPVSGPVALCFDLDGTLIDSSVDLAASINHMLAALGLPARDPTEVRGFIGNGRDMLIRRAAPALTAADMPRAIALFSEHYRAHCCVATAPYEGVPELLSGLHSAGCRIGVATNKPGDFARQIISGLGLDAWIPLPAVIGGDRLRKPDPQQVLAVCTSLSVDPSQTWMVGDHETDLKAGRAAGCRVAFCTWGIGQADAGPIDLTLDRPLALLGHLVGHVQR